MQLENLHPLLVHLPIGIIFIGFFLELWQLKNPGKVNKETMLFILGVAVFFAVLSVATGWFLGNNGGYNEDNLAIHKWLGVAFMLISIGLFFLKRSDALLARKVYIPLFITSLIVLSVTGHYGGNMTHGEDFLFVDHAAKKVEIENIEQAKVFAQVVQPIFEAKCVSCHNPNKTKGGLLLNGKEAILKGGDSGVLFDTISEHDSNLLTHRIELPLQDEEHMPPKGKLQLTEEEKLLLNWWIKNKNCFDCIVSDLPTDARTEGILTSLETDNSTRGKLARELDFISQDEFSQLAKNNISVLQLAEDNPLVQVSFGRRKDVSKEDFESLNVIQENIVEMNLGHTNFDDELAGHLKKFKNLTKLQLQETEITDEAFSVIKQLEYLESLNLFGVEFNVEKTIAFSELSNLTDLYITPSEDSDNLGQLVKNGITVHGLDLDEKFKASKLFPPVIIADKQIFSDSLRVEISSGFEDAETFYSYIEPSGDTITIAYEEPFYLKDSRTLMAFSDKDGWGKSELHKAIFIKTGAKISNASIASKPHKKYTAQGATTLIDKKRGTTNFVDGQWLGYERESLVSTLNFEKPTKLKTVSVGHLSAPTSWIFSPIGYRVWGSTDGKNYRLLKKMQLPPNPPSSEVETKLVNIDFEETVLTNIRVQIVNQRKNPDWHPNPGGDSFIFIDEIVAN